MAKDPDHTRARNRKFSTKFRLDFRGKVRKTHTQSEPKIKAFKRYSCADCDVARSSQWELDRHNLFKRHLATVAEAKSTTKKPKGKDYAALAMQSGQHHCSTCDVAYPSKWELGRLNGSKRHLAKVAAAGTAQAASKQTLCFTACIFHFLPQHRQTRH